MKARFVIALVAVAGPMTTPAAFAQPGASSAPSALSSEERQAQATQAAGAIRRLSPLTDPNMTMRGVVAYQHGGKIAFCGEIVGEEFPVRYAGFVRFISYGGEAVLESPLGAYTQQEEFARLWNSLCEP